MNVSGVVVAGHGVASGRSGSDRFPGGTIALQKPHFAARGVDLSWVHDGTINVDVAPLEPILGRPPTTLRQVQWLDGYPPEDFSFAPLEIEVAGERHRGVLYHPHPETKPEHRQPGTVIEILAARLDAIAPGVAVVVTLDDGIVTSR